MNQPPIVCHPDDTAEAAAELMWENDCGVIPIVDSRNKVLGMITDRDICMAARVQRRPIHSIKVEDAMTTELTSCAPDDSLDVAAARMQSGRVHRLPVVDEDDHILGVISTNDIFREVSRHRGQDSLSAQTLIETLAAICAPQRPVELMERPEPTQLVEL